MRANTNLIVYFIIHLVKCLFRASYRDFSNTSRTFIYVHQHPIQRLADRFLQPLLVSFQCLGGQQSLHLQGGQGKEARKQARRVLSGTP